MHKTYEFTKDSGPANQRKSVAFIHTEIQVTTYAEPLALADAGDGGMVTSRRYEHILLKTSPVYSNKKLKFLCTEPNY